MIDAAMRVGQPLQPHAREDRAARPAPVAIIRDTVRAPSE